MEGEREQELFRAFMRCAHMMHHRKQRYPGQGRLLTLLLRDGSMTQRELQDRMDIRSASLSELLEKMEQSGLISRERSDEDRRTVDIALTDAGLNAAHEAQRERAETAHQLFCVLSEAEQAQLAGLLEKLLAAWSGAPQEE